MSVPASLTDFLLEMRAAALEADTRRAGVIVEMFERARPGDYDNLLAVVEDSPEDALSNLERDYFAIKIAKTMLMTIPNWQEVIRFIQRAILLNEAHKTKRLKRK